MFYVFKLLLTALLIVIISEVSRVNAYVGGIVKSLPLISILSFLWVYAQTRDVKIISDLSLSTFWFVLPTLPLFLLLPLFLKYDMNFYLSLMLSLAIMVVGYFITFWLLEYFGVKF